MMRKIKRATADYTGGGIYIYTGALDDGTFFLTADDWTDCVVILDTDPERDYENAFYQEWQEAHEIAEEDVRLFVEILRWIINNGSGGNYDPYELECRLVDLENLMKEGN